MTETSEAARAKAGELLEGLPPEHAYHRGKVAHFIQQVSDAAKNCRGLFAFAANEDILAPFILPEPVDPLEDALREALQPNLLPAATSYPAALRKALAKRGLKIVEASHDG